LANTDQNFPIINYDLNKSSYQNGVFHGEEYRQGIQELFKIRKNLLLNKNQKLRPYLKDLARQQWNISSQYAPKLIEELQGITDGSGLTKEDLVILNNYTDFRDINLPDEGCSTVHIKTKNNSISGQTWDMHSSAKKYVALINIPGGDSSPGQIYFTLVGCLGMMGASTDKLLIGVNNLNTQNAKASLIWPILVRNAIGISKDYQELVKNVSRAPVTSGHNYLLSSTQAGSMWEVSPLYSEEVASLDNENDSYIFHTNHCMGENNKKIEHASSISQTTHSRYEILEKNVPKIVNTGEVLNLLQGHENYPKSICNHFNNNSADPSATCGGGVVSFNENQAMFWRGCPVNDDFYKLHKFEIINNNFQKMS